MDIQVDPSALDALASRLSGTQGEMSAALDALDGATSALAGAWSGDAQQAFDARDRQWQAELGRYLSVLDAASSAAAQNAETYRTADDRVGALWGM